MLSAKSIIKRNARFKLLLDTMSAFQCFFSIGARKPDRNFHSLVVVVVVVVLVVAKTERKSLFLENKSKFGSVDEENIKAD